MAYGLAHHERDWFSKQHELEIEKQLLQRRLNEIDHELDDLNHTPQPMAIASTHSSELDAPPGKFDEVMQSIFAVGVSIGGIVAIALLIL